MRIQPLTLLRGMLLVILAVGASASARAHDWPFHVDASERYITSVRMPPELHARPTTPTVSKLLRDFQIPPLAKVLRSTVREGLRFSNYMTVPQLFEFEPASTYPLIVSAPVNTAAPTPDAKRTQASVLAEHCLGEEYLPYDFSAVDTFVVDHSITQQQKDQVSSGVRNALANASRMHCEIIDQLHSARFAADAGQAIGALSSDLVKASQAAASSVAAVLSPFNPESLPKYVYLKTRSGIVLAPVHLAQQWQTHEAAPSLDAQVHLLVESGNEFRNAVSRQLRNVAESLHSIASLVAPGDGSRVATRRSANNW